LLLLIKSSLRSASSSSGRLASLHPPELSRLSYVCHARSAAALNQARNPNRGTLLLLKGARLYFTERIDQMALESQLPHKIVIFVFTDAD
jgi:hypothetical protein